MMRTNKTDASQVVLILAPMGKDADLAASVLCTAKMVPKPCQSLSELSERLRAEGSSVGALLLTEESLGSSADCSSLTEWLENQEPWSELPIVVLTRPGPQTRVTAQRVQTLHSPAVTVLERPLRPATLLSALRVALQSRERQYQVRDLLESQRRAGVELQKARLNAEASDRAKDQFLAMVAHELRTPLNAIVGWTYLMRETPNDQTLMAQGLEVLQRNTGTLVELISDLLDTSRIVAGNLTLDLKDVDLKQIVTTSIETLRPEAAKKGVALESLVEIPQEISCRIWGDEARLRQILSNLLTNALKFTLGGGSVSVQLRKTQAKAMIVVKDTGKGISPEFLPHIFERFSRDGAQNPGLGLGLAICKHLVELHGGSISAESEGSGRGALIKVELPTMASNSAAGAERTGANGVEAEGKVPDTRLQSIRVVGVDDNADSRELLKAILQHSGAEASVVGSGQEALEAIRNVHPDVLICDLAMPEMDGYELLEKIRSLEPHIAQLPVIAFTAAAREKDRVWTRLAGFQAHLSKPIDPDELVRTILELVRLRTDSDHSVGELD
jgi:signal transduction histidine kinase/ActR/RegA family two-component response regulator